MFGVLSLLLVGAQACLAYLRRSSPATFTRAHRRVAGAILLTASAHWWPFALFFLPATAVHGMGLTGTFVASETFGEAQSLVAALPKVHVAQILGLSLVSQVFLGFLPVWT